MTFSGGLSTTYQSAVIAANDLLETYPQRKVMVVDTRAAALGQGLFVWYAAKKRDEGLSLEELAARLKGRGTETEESLHRRLGAAVDEIKLATKYRYVVVNDKVEDAEETIANIIEAEHHRSDLNESLLAKLQVWKENK